MPQFQQYDAIRSGMTIPAYGKMKVFYINGELFAIEGKNLSGYKWNSGSEVWESNSDIINFETNPGTGQVAAVFVYSSETYMILGNSTGNFTGYKWDSANSQWLDNAAIAAGLTDQGTHAAPTVFYVGADLYLLSGLSSGLLSGFKWNGSAWVANSIIITGVTDIGNYSYPEVFSLNGELYLISATTGFVWNSSTEQWDSSSISTGFIPGGSYPCPTLFEIDSQLYAIASTSNGGYSYAYLASAKLDSTELVSNGVDGGTLEVVLTSALDTGESLIAYVAPTEAGLGSEEHLVTLTEVDGTNYSADIDISDNTNYYIQVTQVYSGSDVDELTASGTFYLLDQINDTIINIVSPNHLTPAVTHSYNHGSIYYEGYIYGSARAVSSGSGAGIIKINATDYTSYAQNHIYVHKNTASGEGLIKLDQIRECSGFLWMQTSQYLIRVNPGDLDYMIFEMPEAGLLNQPIGTDGTYLFFCGDINVYKVATSQLIGSFASYGYTGDDAVSIPESAILGICAVNQVSNPTFNWKTRVHSIISDTDYIYIQCNGETINSATAEGVFLSHFQKIRISDMMTVGDTYTPTATDDCVQNSEYVFLLPELTTGYTCPETGKTWGVFAVKKTTLEIKHLNGLHSDYADPDNPTIRKGYGIFLFGDNLAVQLVSSKKTIIIDISNIHNWGDNLPIGSETVAIYSFQIEGSSIAYALNELVYDAANGWVHSNTWEVDTTFIKWPLSSFSDVTIKPIIQTTLVSSSSNNATFRGSIIDTGESAMTSVGFLYGTDPESMTTNVPATLGTSFEETLSELDPGIYYIKAWGVNTEGTWYGNTVIFSTYNVLTLSYDNDDAVLEWIDENYGCSIRCVQDAPGVADGTTGTATDQDGNTYDTIVINQKRWFVQNLKALTYRNGEAIPEVTDNSAWAALADGGRCFYDNEE